MVPNRRFELPDLKSFQQVIIEKQAFDVFTNPNTERAVRQFGSGVRVLMDGVATDICVACAANALLDRGYRVELVGDAIAALDEKKAAAFVQSFIRKGGKLVKTRTILREARAA